MRVLIALAILGAAFAVPQDPQRIVGGSATTIQQYPFMASMDYLWWGFFWSPSCGGSLITTTTVLSAAHCYHGDRPAEWRTRLGSTSSRNGGTIHATAFFIIHERYNTPTRLENDVAIVRLATPAVLSASVGLARIAGAGYNLADNTAVTAVGWGALWYEGPSSDTLQHVQVFTINQNICTQRYAFLKTQPGHQNTPDVTANMLCAGILDVGGRDACQGDSGGPLLHQGDIVVGITSWGHECAHATYPGVNARVANYANWIVNNA
ncbi:Trypsin CFT-1 [Eumeta japonica]|uniref:Trypsin CFT-1 n=1 Tax=Eumeta variegata TaxID=151549 RepID=A0A4C1SD49_EUMVA|nr:Trypsin CFT-1 [Eumeta japonica]